MSWGDQVVQQNTDSHIIDVYDHPNVLTLKSDIVPINFEVNFILMDSRTHQKLINVPVTFNSFTIHTNSEGTAVFTVTNDTYDYSIYKPSFTIESGSLTISSDTGFVYYLVQTHANVKFKVYSGLSPLNNSRVILGEDTIVTNSLGISLFKVLPVNANYSFSISKTGYYEQSGDFQLITDTTINLTLEKYPIGIKQAVFADRITLRPNPVSEILYCSFPESCLHKTVMITDITGRMIYNEKLMDDELSMNLKEYPSGVYTLRVFSGEGFVSQRFIKY
jgi:hypothetical protein